MYIIEVDGKRTVIGTSILSKDDLIKVQNILRDAKVLVSTFSGIDPYSYDTYLQQEGFYDTETKLIFDTNVFRRVVKLAHGKEANNEDIVPAAVMAFAACARLITAPALSLYEEVASNKLKGPNKDLAYFLAGDDLHPREWADIALGRASKLRTALQPPTTHRYSFRKPLRFYNLSYPIVLKLALVQLAGGKRTERMARYLQWTFNDWLFSAPASLLAVRLFSSEPPRKALKRIASSDRQLALKGVCNCTRDLTIINHFMDQYKKQNTANGLAVMCSLDRLLCEITSDLQVAFDGRDVFSEQLAECFGKETLELYQSLEARLDDPRRKYKAGEDYSAMIVRQLEGEFLSWKPSPGRAPSLVQG